MSREWSSAECATLSRLWPLGYSRASLSQKLPGRTWYAIVTKARELGCKSGPPQGYVSLSEAERRLGYSRSTLREIFALAEVASRRIRPGAQSRRREGWTAYEFDEAREAVERWISGDLRPAALRSSKAAEALGEPAAALVAAARFAAGTTAKLGRGTVQRAPLDEWRSMLAAWRASADPERLELSRDAAARLDENRRTLEARAAALGLRAEVTGAWVLPRGEWDRIASMRRYARGKAPSRWR